MLRRLADRDVVHLERDPDDARTVVVSLTDRGRALRPALDEVHCRIREAVGLTETELSTLQATLRRVSERLESD